jgi:hypothetical protein
MNFVFAAKLHLVAAVTGLLYLATFPIPTLWAQGGRSSQVVVTPPASTTVRVKVPSNTPAGDTIGIFRGQLFPTRDSLIRMTRVPGTTDTWQATITGPSGTVIDYEFYRNDNPGLKEAYVPIGSSNRQVYRKLLLTDGASLSETVAQWMDLPRPADISTGTLTGTVTDVDGIPLMGIWVSAGPHQTLTDTDGNFTIYGVPSGPCTITVHSENGEFHAVNIRTTISPNNATVQNVALTAATMSPVTFRVTVPSTTPAGAVPRLYGDTYRLGMVHIPGGPIPDTTRAIEMTSAGGNEWTYTAQLGNGTCINYLYTLGSYRLNYERDAQGTPFTRALCVNGSTVVNDTVAAWKTLQQVPVSLTVTSPTGAEDALYVATDDYVGHAPVKMWPTGPGKAAYTIYVNPSTTLNYYYVRNTDDGIGPEIVNRNSNPPAYRSIAVGPNGATSVDTIMAWQNQMREPPLSTVTSGITDPIVRTAPFQTGIALVDYWRSSWLPLVQPTLARVKSMNAQWVQIEPPWSFLSTVREDSSSYITTTTDPPKVDPRFNEFPLQDLLAHIRAAKAAGLHVALTPEPYPNGFTGSHSTTWYDQFFQQVQSTFVYFAKIAQQEGIEMLILGDFALDADINNEAVTRRYINGKWKEIIAAIRTSGFTGKLACQGGGNDGKMNWPEYDWYADLDYIGLFWSIPVATSSNDSVQSMYQVAMSRLASQYRRIFDRFQKPLIFTSVMFYSARSSALQTYNLFDVFSPQFAVDPSVPSDYDEQGRAYQALFRAFAATPWVYGAYSFGYEYFNLDSKGYSIRGKTAEKIVSNIYQHINAAVNAAEGATHRSFQLSDRGSVSQTTSGSRDSVETGFARIISYEGTTPSGIAIFGFRQNGVLISEAAVPAAPLIHSGRIYVEVAGRVNTGIAIANPSDRDATINFFYADATGADIFSGTTTVAANSQTAAFLDQAPFATSGTLPNLTNVRTFTFVSSAPVGVIALRGYTNERAEFLMTTLPVSPINSGSTAAFAFPHFADGGGWTSAVVLINPTDVTISGTAQFYSKGTASTAGAPLTLTVNSSAGSTFTYTIPARSAFKLQTAGAQSGIQTGWVKVTPSSGSVAPSGLVVFSFQSNGVRVSEASVPAQPVSSAFRMYAEASDSIQTGIAISNPAASNVTVNFELTNVDGTSTGMMGTTIVPATGQVAMFLTQIPGFGSVPASFRGVLRISGANVFATGLRGRSNERGDFLITTTAPVDENAAPSAAEYVFPHLADGGGYTTQFILFSGTAGQSSTGALEFLTQSGQPLRLSLQ